VPKLPGYKQLFPGHTTTKRKKGAYAGVDHHSSAVDHTSNNVFMTSKTYQKSSPHLNN